MQSGTLPENAGHAGSRRCPGTTKAASSPVALPQSLSVADQYRRRPAPAAGGTARPLAQRRRTDPGEAEQQRLRHRVDLIVVGAVGKGGALLDQLSAGVSAIARSGPASGLGR